MKRTHGVSAEDKINGTVNLDTTSYFQKQKKSMNKLIHESILYMLHLIHM